MDVEFKNSVEKLAAGVCGVDGSMGMLDFATAA